MHSAGRKVLALLFLLLTSSPIVPSLHAQERDPLLAQADSLRLAGETDAVLPLYDRFLSANPDHRDGLYGRGVVYIKRREIEKGSADLQKAIIADPNCSRCYFWLAQGAVMRGKNEEGLGYLGRAIGIDSSDVDFWVLRAKLQTSLSAALDDFNRAVALNPKDPAILSDRANFYLNNSSPMMALQEINAAIALDSTFASAYFTRAQIYLGRRDTARAFQDANKAVRLGYYGADLFWFRGGMNEALGAIDSALADYTAYLERDPTSYQVFHSRAMVRYKKEDMDGSCRDLERALELIGDNKEAHAIAIVAWNGWCDSSTKNYFYHRGIAEFNLGNYARAVEWHEKGIKKFPESLILRSFRGNAALALGRYPLVVQDYEYVLSRFDHYFEEWWAEVKDRQPLSDKEEARRRSFSDGYAALAMAKGQMKDFDRGIALIDSAIAVERSPEALYNQRGLLNLWAGELKQAIKDFETSLSFAPDNPQALANRSIVYLIQATTSQTHRITTFGLGFTMGEGKSASASFPISARTARVDLDLVKMARADLDRAIARDGSMGPAYEYRAYARKLLGDAGYCEDMENARKLGPESGLGLTPECR